MQRLGWGIVSASGLVIALVGGCATNNSDGLIGGAGGTGSGTTVSSTKSTSAGPTTSAGTTTSVTSATSATSVTSTVAATSSVSTTNSVQSATANSSTSSGMVPAGWNCDAAFYNTGASFDCDCGCGAPDPDCADALSGTCDYCDDTGSCGVNAGTCPGFIDPTNNSKCFAAMPENTAVACADMIDNDQDGDTDCADADCAGFGPCGPENTAAKCSDSIDNDNDGSTDCADADCAGLGPCGPENTAAKCSDSIDNDNDGDVDCSDTDCYGQPGCPAVGWTCPASYYDEGSATSCDCGCGVHDPDCADSLVATCNYCTSGCSMSACPGTVNPTNNAICP